MTTIADVARHAGVSISTVSYVMSGKRAISPETQERVQRAIDELGYQPHASARSLASRRANVIGLQAPLRVGVDVQVVMRIVAGVVREARARGYDILLLTSDDAAGLERAAGASMVDAFLVMDIESHDPRIATLESLDRPAVLVGKPEGAGSVPCVDFDFEAAGRLAAERLARLGRSRLALLGAPAEVVERQTSYAERLTRGFLAGAEDAGASASIHACPSGAAAADLARALLSERNAPTGFLVHNEAALPHIAPIAAAEGAAVVALAPIDLARTASGMAGVIDIPAEDIGTAAAHALGELLAGREVPETTLLPPTMHLLGASRRTD